MTEDDEALSCFIESPQLMRFLNRLRNLESLDHSEVPDVTSWRHFRHYPFGYLINCRPDEAQHIWTALRKREK